MAGLVPSNGPFVGPRPAPDDERAVPNEFVPGVAALVPKAPPVTDMCDPMPPPRANAVAVERLTQKATQRTQSVFMLSLHRTRDQRRSLKRIHLTWVRNSPAPLKLMLFRAAVSATSNGRHALAEEDSRRFPVPMNAEFQQKFVPRWQEPSAESCPYQGRRDLFIGSCPLFTAGAGPYSDW